MSIPLPKARQDMSSWELCIRFTPRCQQQHWYVQRYDDLRDVWRVTLAPGDAGWLEAAPDRYALSVAPHFCSLSTARLLQQRRAAGHIVTDAEILTSGAKAGSL